MNKNTKISLVGAGPGDPDLITLKGLKAIQTADVILYDALIDPTLLENAPSYCEKIYVGKRSGCHYKTQDQINLLLVQSALKYGHAVRLKGGDPFVFGRGHEELEYAKAFDIPVQVVPGISSSLSLPLLQEVPLTKRNKSESFWVLTATTKQHKLSQDIKIAAQSTATLVILMGMRKIQEIADLLQNQGRRNTPMMVIQNGSRSDEKVTLGTVQEFLSPRLDIDVTDPGIIVIGEVVSLHPHFVQSIHHAVNQTL